MTPLFRNTLLWIFGSALMVLMALSVVSASYVNGHYLPSNPDAFYHARRILDAVMTHQPVIQFDPRIHAPEGSWLTWPWGYDSLLAWITGWFGPFPDEVAAGRVLMHVPVAMIPVAVALVLVLARQLRLSTVNTALLVFAFAVLPLAFMLFAVGNVDHHSAEFLWVMATMCASIWMFDSATPRAAIVLALVLGSAVAMQNGLFILQIVPLAVLGWRWLRRDALPSRRVLLTFAAVLFVATLLACLPSEPLRRGFFEFYTLSWFHVYIAFCTGAVFVLLAVLPRTTRNIAIAAAAALLLAIPIFASLDLASRFVSGDLESVAGISEALSPYRMYFQYGPAMSTLFTSWFMWLSLPALLVNAWWVWKTKDARLQAFAIASVIFLALYQFQYRFAPFGMVSLLATPLLAAQQLAERVPGRAAVIRITVMLLFVVAYAPTRIDWPGSWARGGDPVYDKVRPTLPALAQACARDPGIVLAPVDDGHWITFHTQCSVISDVFLLTEQHAQKRRETERLLALTPQQLLATRPDIRFVLANFQVDVIVLTGADIPEWPDLEKIRPSLGALQSALLGPASGIPPQFHLLGNVDTPAGRPYTRLYEIVREPAGTP